MKRMVLGVLLIIFSGICLAGEINGRVLTSKIKTAEGILVYIEKIEGKEFPPPSEPAKMDQLKLVFTPRILPVLKGTTVEFHNSDDLKHNVFGIGVEDFDLGVWTMGITKPYTFNKLGDTAILCNVHPEMEAYVYVLQNPYFGLTDKDGNYQIKEVPVGKYNLKTWHDRLKTQGKEVEVTSGAIVVDFNL